MNQAMKAAGWAVVALAVVLAATGPSMAQDEGGGGGGGGGQGPPKNLKVLPADTPRKEVSALMKQFNAALGVKCVFCHNTKDYASDEKHEKDIARAFMRMTRQMQKDTFNYEGAPNITYNCYVCHQGQKEPRLKP